jgi:hypothetical protein
MLFDGSNEVRWFKSGFFGRCPSRPSANLHSPAPRLGIATRKSATTSCGRRLSRPTSTCGGRRSERPFPLPLAGPRSCVRSYTSTRSLPFSLLLLATIALFLRLTPSCVLLQPDARSKIPRLGVGSGGGDREPLPVSDSLQGVGHALKSPFMATWLGVLQLWRGLLRHQGCGLFLAPA